MQHPNYQPPPGGGGGAHSFPPPPATQPLPPGWEQAADPVSGRPYFANRTTGETSWVPPPCFPPPPPPPPPQVLPVQQPIQPFQQPPHPMLIPGGAQPVMGQPMMGGAPPVMGQPMAVPAPQIIANNLPGGMPVQPNYSQQYTPIQPQVGIVPNQPMSIPQPQSAIHTAPTSSTGFGASTATTPGLLVSSVRAMINEEQTQRSNGTSVPKLELEGLSAGAIADLCNVSRELKAKNVDGGDFAGDTSETAADCNKRQGEEEEGVDQYYLPLKPFSLPIASMAPHIEPGRVDIRLHALHSKLANI